MAFQPIVDVETRRVFAHEALVRGEQGEGAGFVFDRVTENNKYSFDQTCRVTAIRDIARLDPTSHVSINFLPNAIYDPETCLARTLAAADKYNFPRENIIFEVTEHEKIENRALLRDVFSAYKAKGFRTAIDDFGEGFAGLNLLAEFQPDILKLDMKLVQGISNDKVKQSILSGIQTTANHLNVELIAEGIEDRADYLFLKTNKIKYMQGYFFAKPKLEGLPSINWD
ncbi:EAL domain-containing protein [Pleionea litopenaei]|uniref:EAL domain-containing protein n=1 Tax=Pleionea litopenaei TaxID=3070815 RepID=A0AA51RSK9_9GAMM|nr:EAL domain-containing protein [Pleionea sp. HL-JVS1]WMS86820.1 EAL domain-containing protein [Pleionea sp. HL-JVS1]